MTNVHLYTELLVNMLSHMLGTIDGTVTPACAAATDLQVRKTTLEETCHMKIDQFVDAVKKREYFTICFEKVNNRLIKACKRLILFIPPGIVGTATVKHISSSIATLISWDTLLEGEGIDVDDKRTLLPLIQIGAVILQIGCHFCIVLRFQFPTLFLFGIAGNKHLCHVSQIRITITGAQRDLFLQITNSKRNAVGKVRFLLPKPPISISAKHLQNTEKNKEVKTTFEESTFYWRLPLED